MKKYIVIAVLLLSALTSRLAADYVIWTDYQPAGKTLRLKNTGSATNYLELWRWTDSAGSELVTRWDVNANYETYSWWEWYDGEWIEYQDERLVGFSTQIDHRFPSVSCSGNEYELTLSNLPDGYYYFSIGEGGGYPYTWWHGLWDGVNGSLGWFPGYYGNYGAFHSMFTMHLDFPPSVASISSSGFSDANNYFEVYANAARNVRRVLFPTWTTANGQDELVWYEGVYDAANDRWKASVPLNRHNYETGQYITHVYLEASDGTLYWGGDTTTNVSYAATPTVASISCTGEVRSDETFEVSAHSVRSGRRVLFAVWTPNYGQDDLVWHEGVYDAANDRWKTAVPVSSHFYESGTYITHVYVEGVAGGWHYCGDNVTEVIHEVQPPNYD
jgi:hypothetical protein